MIAPANPQPPAPPVITTGVSDAGNTAIHETYGEANATPPRPKNRATSPETWMTWLTAIIAAATVANVLIFYLESEDTSKQIGKLTDKASGIVDSMNTALADSRTAISNAFDANRKAVEANRQQSQKVFMIEQRPYVVTDLPIFTPAAMVANQDVSVNVTFKNIGKTPAIKVLDDFDLVPYLASGKTRDDFRTFIDSSFADLEKKNRKARAELRTAPKARRDTAPEASFFASRTIQLPDVDVRRVLDNEEKTRGSVSFFALGLSVTSMLTVQATKRSFALTISGPT
jgi:hypothetical protein